MKTVKVNMDSLTQVNKDLLYTYFKSFRVNIDEHNNVPIKFGALNALISLSVANKNTKDILDHNHELISAVLSECNLSYPSRKYLLEFAGNEYINSILKLASD